MKGTSTFYLFHSSFATSHYLHWKVWLTRVHCNSCRSLPLLIIKTCHHLDINKHSRALLWGFSLTWWLWHLQQLLKLIRKQQDFCNIGISLPYYFYIDWTPNNMRELWSDHHFPNREERFIFNKQHTWLAPMKGKKWLLLTFSTTTTTQMRCIVEPEKWPVEVQNFKKFTDLVK